MTHPHHEAQQLRRRTRLALSAAAAELSDEALALVATFGEEDFEPGNYTVIARRINALSHRAQVLAVLCDRIVRGATWDQVARRRGLTADQVRQIYQVMEDRWRAGSTAPWAPKMADGEAEPAAARFHPIEITNDNSRAVATALDRFCRRRLCERQPRGEQPVTSGLLSL